MVSSPFWQRGRGRSGQETNTGPRLARSLVRPVVPQDLDSERDAGYRP